MFGPIEGVMVVIALVACVSGDEGGPNGEDTAPAVDPGPATLLGDDDHPVVFTAILTEDDKLTDPRDLGFDPEGRLWVANREDDRTFILENPGTSDQTVERRKDGYAEHFMEEVAAFAFEDGTANGEFGNEWASCGDSENTYNGAARPNGFMGPTLWTSDLSIFAEENPIGLGSHLDMLHYSPLCVGLAWERDNVYWAFDGFNSALVRYDFAKDHAVGMDDHSDGSAYRYAEPELKRVDGAPGHVVFDHRSGIVYVADTGNDRILWIDSTTGERGKDLRQSFEDIEDYAKWDSADWGELVKGLDKPGGLALVGDQLIVGEWGSGMMRAFSLEGEELGSLDTELGPEVLHGIELGPDGALWIAEIATPAVHRLSFE